MRNYAWIIFVVVVFLVMGCGRRVEPRMDIGSTFVQADAYGTIEASHKVIRLAVKKTLENRGFFLFDEEKENNLIIGRNAKYEIAVAVADTDKVGVWVVERLHLERPHNEDYAWDVWKEIKYRALLEK